MSTRHDLLPPEPASRCPCHTAAPAGATRCVMTCADEDVCRATARQIEEQHPGWMIMWGVYTRTFVAFPLFAARRRIVVTAAYPDVLLEWMEQAERRLRLRPPAGGGPLRVPADDPRRHTRAPRAASVARPRRPRGACIDLAILNRVLAGLKRLDD